MFLSKQDFREPTTCLNTKRGQNNYIKPILYEDSIVHTPSLLADSIIKTKTIPQSFFIKPISVNQNESPLLTLQESQDNLIPKNNKSIKTVMIIIKRMNQTYHSIISLYCLSISFTGQMDTLYQFRIIGIFLIISYLILHTILNKNTQTLSFKNFTTQDGFTLLIYILSFIYENLYFWNTSLSLLYIQFTYKFIRITLLLLFSINYFLHFFIPEFFLLIYYVHLCVNLKTLQQNQFNYQNMNYFQSINQVFEIVLFDFTQLNEFENDGKLQIFFIILNFIYIYSIIERFVQYKESYLYKDSFKIFIEDKCIQHNTSIIKLFQFLWKIDKERIITNFIQQLTIYKNTIYKQQILKCNMLSKLFSSPLLDELSKFSTIIQVKKNNNIQINGLYIIIEGKMKIRLSQQFEFSKILESGDYIGLRMLFSEQIEQLELSCLTQECYLLNISMIIFNQIIRQFDQDFEKMRFVSDKIHFTENTQLLEEKCLICSKYHDLKNCNTINYKPVIDIEKLKQSQINSREIFQRLKVKQRTYYGNSLSLVDSDEFEETFIRDPIEETVSINERSVGKNLLNSISQMIMCHSKVEQEVYLQQRTQSYQLGDTIQVLSASQNLKQFETEHVNYQIDKIQNYKIYDPKYNIDYILLNYY